VLIILSAVVPDHNCFPIHGRRENVPHRSRFGIIPA